MKTTVRVLLLLSVLVLVLVPLCPGYSLPGKPPDTQPIQFDTEPEAPKGLTPNPTPDLITPLNAQPITIDEALSKRLKIMGKPAKKIILVVTDGLSASMLRLSRDILVGRENRLELDRFPVIGRMIGYPQDGSVNDSAAAATSFSTGRIGLQGKVAVDAAGKPIETLFENAKARGFKVGLITDTRMTHATPAPFATHTGSRENELAIAEQLVQSNFQVLLSGGRKFFQPIESGGEQPNGKDLLAIARRNGYQTPANKMELASATVARAEKVLGLFAPSYMPDPWERIEAEHPSLAEMSAAALSLLAGSDQGFLLMVEAGKFDMAAHDHDPFLVVSLMKELNDLLRVLTDYVQCNPETLLVVISDHATGGMQITDAFDAQQFKSLGTSTVYLVQKMKNSPESIAPTLKKAFPGLTFSAEEISHLVNLPKNSDFALELGTIVSAKFGLTFLPSRVDWEKSAVGHTGEDLFIHTLGCHQGLFGGVIHIWEIPERLAAALGFSFPLPEAH